MRFFIVYIAIAFLFSLSLTAQQNNTLHGKILFLNSGNTPAVGVELSGSIKISDSITISANPVYSKNDGSYRLVFPQAVVGSVVTLNVGTTDSKGQALEVVNEEELRICRIPEDPADTFEIIVCKKGERDFVAKKYYGILKTAADYELDRMKKQWSALVEESEKDYQKISEMSERITQLEKQADSLQLYKDALRIASINKDNATKRVKKYLKLLDKGISIQEARKQLSINKAIDELEVGTLKFNAAVTELQTRATASKSMFDYKDAIKCYDTLIYYAEKMGVDRLKIAGYYGEIADVIFDDGKYESALEYEQKAMEIREEILGLKHPALVASYGNIGHIYQHLAHHEKALKYQQKTIDVWEETLNSKHPSIAVSYNNIAQTYMTLGQYETALKYQQKALDIEEEVLNPKHPHIVTSYSNIGHIYQHLGQYETALKYQQKALNIEEKTLEIKHPSLAKSYANIAITYQDLGQYGKALKYNLKAINIRKAVLDPKHPDLATSYNNIATIYNTLGQYEKALEYQEKSIAIMEEVINPKHPDLAISYNNIAIIYNELEQHEKALKYQQRDIDICEEVLGSKHPSLATSYNNISTTYYALGQYQKALEYQQKSIGIRKGVLPSKHQDVGVIYSNLAIIYKAIKDFQKAINFQKKCLAIFKEALPKDHPYQEKALNNLAIIYYTSKNYPKTIAIYQKLVTAFPEVKEKDFYNNIGLAYTKNKQFKEAQKAFSKYEKLFPDKGQTYRNWSVYYALQGEKEKALNSLKKAITLGYTDIKWLKTDDSMDSLRNEKAFMQIIGKLEKQ